MQEINKLVTLAEIETEIENKFGIDYFLEDYAAIIEGSKKSAALAFFEKIDEYGEEIEFPGINLSIYLKDENGNIDPGSPEIPLYRVGVFTVEEVEEIIKTIVFEDFSAESLAGFIVTDDNPYF